MTDFEQRELDQMLQNFGALPNRGRWLGIAKEPDPTDFSDACVIALLDGERVYPENDPRTDAQILEDAEYDNHLSGIQVLLYE